MGNLDDPAYRTARIAARSVLAPLSVTPPSTPRPFFDNVDATHPLYIDFVLPNGVQPFVAKLSFKLRAYRTYSSLTLSNTGGQSATHSHTESTHHHTHSHTIATGLATLAAFLGFNALNSPSSWVIGTAIGNTGTGDTTPPTNTDSTDTAIGPTGNASNDHTHSVSGTSLLGVAEGASTTITAIAVDGVDKTALLGGGPWAADTVDLDLTAVMPVGNGAFHTITLTPSGLGRIVGELRLG